MPDDKASDLGKLLLELSQRKALPSQKDLIKFLNASLQTMASLSSSRRPLDDRGLPGGLVISPDVNYSVILPDLHGRRGFFYRAITKVYQGEFTLLQDVLAGKALAICVGDAFHSEVRGKERWMKAMDEFSMNYKTHKAIDQEMIENLGLLMMLCLVKKQASENFFFLKGNHENIANERGEGNYPFRKYAYEGEMVRSWTVRFMGQEVFDHIYQWEKALPVGLQGKDFLVTHAEPGRKMRREEIINCYLSDDVIYLLTWVNNGQAEEGSVAHLLDQFFPEREDTKIFGGHRPTTGAYSLRQNGRYVQINRPDTEVVAYVTDIITFDPEKNIIELENQS